MKITKLKNGKLVIDGENNTIILTEEGSNNLIQFEGFEDIDGFVLNNFIQTFDNTHHKVIKALLKF